MHGKLASDVRLSTPRLHFTYFLTYTDMYVCPRRQRERGAKLMELHSTSTAAANANDNSTVPVAAPASPLAPMPP